MMRVFIEKENKATQLKFSGTGKSLLRKLKVGSETVLIIRNGELVPDDERLCDSDDIKLVSVISGG